MTDTYDVIISGGSVAGATAAILYARRGARVALVERRADMSAYKVLCTHYIQACAYPVIAELGLTGKLEAAGAVRNSAEYWTRWGWIRPEAGPPGDGAGTARSLPYGYNVRRQTLDPLLRDLAAATPGVDLYLGHTVSKLLTDDDGRVTGVAGTSAAGPFAFRARLTVGADGRDSVVAKLAGARAKTVENNRFSYFAQFRGLPRPDGDMTKCWFLEPDVAYAMPNDGDITVIACIPAKDKLGDFKADLEGSYRSFVRSLPGAPDIDAGERVGKIVGTVNYPLIAREPAGPGYALIGDAALSSDPLWGVGCGWAFQSARWLVESTAGAVQGVGSVDRGLRGYRRKRSALSGHQHLISDYASGRPFNGIERLMFSAAARDHEMARLFHIFGARVIGVRKFLSPAALTKALVVNARRQQAPLVPEAVPATHDATSI
jgi:flavin-dependent dehydrogenase